jgi:ATP-binding cassette subfamily C protein PrsD
MSVPNRPASPAKRENAISAALGACRGAFVATGIFSGVVNVLMLTGSIYMLQIYDRVLASHSVPTLLAISAIALFAFGVQGLMDALRSRLLVRIAERVDSGTAPAVFELVSRMPLNARNQRGEPLQPVRDLDAVRGFLAGQGPTAFFDLPWMPLYLAIVFLLHPWLGWLAVGGMLVLTVVALVTEFSSRQPSRDVALATSERNAILDAAHRGADVLASMGLRAPLARRFERANETALTAHRGAGDIIANSGALARTLRYILQSAVLGLAAYLAMRGQISPGGMIAASILTARALAPVDLAIASWRGFVAARQGYTRLVGGFGLLPPPQERIELPAPKKALTVQGLAIAAPGEPRLLLQRAEFVVEAGSAVAIIGPSAAGKSTLLRAIAGIIPPARGTIALDGARLDLWGDEALGRHIGYLPQEVQLFDGTVTENISRFADDPDPQAVIEAAKLAGFHEAILKLPEGYETKVGPGGTRFSVGQRQRLGLARAMYGDPFLVLLDEPNANLDAEGEAAVSEAIRVVRQRGGVAIVVAHRPSALASVDKVLIVRDGAQFDYGPKDEVLGRHVANVSRLRRPAGLKPVESEQ